MSVQKLPGGVTVSSGPDSLASQIDWSDPQHPKLPGYRVAIGPDGGIVATKNDGFYDIGVPILIGSIFAIGAATGGAGFAGAGSGGGAGAGGAAGATADALPTAVPALPWTLPAADIAGGAGVIPGVDLGAGGVSALSGAAGAGGAAAAAAKNFLSSRGGAASLAALIPALTALGRNGNGGPFGGGQTGTDIGNEVLAGLRDQRQRFNATGPAFQTAQNMALGMAPTAYRASGNAGPFGG